VLGTTIKVAASHAAFQAIDLDANADSRVFYNRVKGQLEQALAHAVPRAQGRRVLSSGAMQGASQGRDG